MTDPHFGDDIVYVHDPPNRRCFVLQVSTQRIVHIITWPRRRRRATTSRDVVIQEAFHEALSASLSTFARALHPMAGFVHFGHYASAAACGYHIHDYRLASSANLDHVTCPECVSALLRRLTARAFDPAIGSTGV